MKLGILIIPDDNAEVPAILNQLRDVAGATSVELTPSKSAAVDDDLSVDLGVDNDDFSLTEPELPPRTLKDLKTVLSRVRDELGNKTLVDILTAFGATRLSDIDEDDYSAVYAAGEEALKKPGDDDGFDLGLDDDDPEPLDPVAIKDLCQEYAKKHGKAKATAILEKAGLNTVRGLKSASQEQLQQIHAAVS